MALPITPGTAPEPESPPGPPPRMSAAARDPLGAVLRTFSALGRANPERKSEVLATLVLAAEVRRVGDMLDDLVEAGSTDL